MIPEKEFLALLFLAFRQSLKTNRDYGLDRGNYDSGYLESEIGSVIKEEYPEVYFCGKWISYRGMCCKNRHYNSRKGLMYGRNKQI